MQIDIEKLASGYGERAIADGRYTLSKGDYILSLDDLKRYTALALEEAEKAQDDWKAMVYAPRDGTAVEMLIEHRTWWTAHKCSPDEVKIWRAVCEAKWIDHNGGGWTWEGMAGTPTGWRTLSRQITEGTP